MSIHILVPQSRLAELLKKEQSFAWITKEGVEKTYADIDALVAENKLANHLGYQYTVDTDAAYFESLEDMLDAEE